MELLDRAKGGEERGSGTRKRDQLEDEGTKVGRAKPFYWAMSGNIRSKGGGL